MCELVYKLTHSPSLAAKQWHFLPPYHWGKPERAPHYHVYGGGGGGGEVLSFQDGQRQPRPTTSQARAMTSTRTSSMGGAPPLLAMNGKGYTVLHVHNESFASGQSTRTSSMGRAPPLLAMNGWGLYCTPWAQ